MSSGGAESHDGLQRERPVELALPVTTHRVRRLCAVMTKAPPGGLWVAAPTGFGKTRLLAAWRAATARRGADAVTVDVSVLHSGPRLAETLRREAAWFLLDDVWDQANLEQQGSILATARRGGARVVVTRRTPPGAWEAEAAGDWATIGASELAFQAADCTEFFPGMAAPHLERLIRITEGWPVAIDLAFRVGRAASKPDWFLSDSPELNALSLYLEARAPGGDVSRLLDHAGAPAPVCAQGSDDLGLPQLLSRAVASTPIGLQAPGLSVTDPAPAGGLELDDEINLIGFVLRNGYEGLRRLLACVPFRDVAHSANLRHGHTFLLCLDRFIDNESIDDPERGGSATINSASEDGALADLQRRIFGDGLQSPDFLETLNELVSGGPITAPELLVLQRLYMGFSLQCAGDYPHALVQLRQALQLCQTHGFDFGRAIISLHLARIESITGPLDGARKRLVEARALVRRSFRDEHALLANLNLCSLALELDAGSVSPSASNLAAAGELVGEGKASFELFAVLSEVEAAKAMLGLTPPEAFAEVILDLRKGAGRSAERSAFLDALWLLVRLSSADAADAGAALGRLKASLGEDAVHWRLRDTLELAALRARLDGDAGGCARSAAAFAASARATHRQKSAIRALLLAAAAAGRMGGDTQRPMLEALDLAARSGIVLPFLEDHAHCAPRLAAMLDDPDCGDQTARGMAQRLIERLEALAARRSGQLLSRRERQVLAQLGGGGTNKVIARALGLSERTVKFHLANIAGKLSVTTRRQILDAAARLGLTADPLAG